MNRHSKLSEGWEGGAWIKFRIEISIPENFAGLCLGHLLKCLATVVSLLFLTNFYSELYLCTTKLKG